MLYIECRELIETQDMEPVSDGKWYHIIGTGTNEITVGEYADAKRLMLEIARYIRRGASETAAFNAVNTRFYAGDYSRGDPLDTEFSKSTKRQGEARWTRFCTKGEFVVDATGDYLSEETLVKLRAGESFDDDNFYSADDMCEFCHADMYDEVEL